MLRAPSVVHVLALGLTLLAASPSFGFTVEATTQGLRVRSTPGGAVLGSVAAGQRLEADVQREGWLRVGWRGRQGWVSAAHVRRVAAGSASQADLEVLARIIKGEANNCSFEGKVAVAAVVLNRVRSRSFPNTIAGVAHQPWQFSCYNPDVRARLYGGRIPQACFDAARAALAGRDPSRGATYYFNPYVVKPSWARSMRLLVRIGTTSTTTHDFYAPR